jgi:hypothetical protein
MKIIVQVNAEVIIKGGNLTDFRDGDFFHDDEEDISKIWYTALSMFCGEEHACRTMCQIFHLVIPNPSKIIHR